MSQQHVVKKHVAAIHISNNISLLQRKISNVLLLNAAPEMREKDEHTISTSALADMIGFDSKNTEYLKEALEGLASTTIKWNLMDERGTEEEWGVAAILSYARIISRSGLCKYGYPAPLKQLLADPKIYALIDVRIQRRFNSAYGLALFENCLRYVNVGKTPVWPLEIFKKLLGVPEDSMYEDFKKLNYFVIKKAIKEVNTVSTIELDLIQHKEARRVVAVQFTVKDKRQEELQLEAPLFDTKLLARLTEEFELTEPQAKNVLSMHSEEYINGNLAVVAERVRAGKVKEIGPYTLKAFKEDFRIKPSKLKEQKRVEQAAREKAAAALPAELAQAKAYLEGLDGEARAALENAYLQAPHSPLIKKRLAEGGLANKLVMGDFLGFVTKQLKP